MFTVGEPIPAIGRKRIRTDEEENANVNEKRRIHEEEEAGQKELNRQNGNQESHKKVEETEDGTTEGFDEGEAGGNLLGRKRKHQDDENGGSGNNFNHQNSEQNECGNQESGEGKGGEEEERRATEKGKQPMSCKCEAMVRDFFDFEQGESSKTNEDETPSDIDDHRDLAILRSM
uniref:Retinitis pigmentosa GTPase regulator n=1 Tax=Solanum tuberosum TaxID=4113 RepID=M1DCV1_SOLTU